MSSAAIPRGVFRNPQPDPATPAAGRAVESLLSTVSDAAKRFGEPTSDDYALARLSLDELQARLLSERTLTLPQLVEARIRLTVHASLTTHCLTAFPYHDALDAAARYQSLVEATAEPTSLLADQPLLGLVFSIKDCIHVQGFATTLGCSSRADQLEEGSAEVVQKLLAAGAIMIAKTTAPQLMMSNTTHSPLWGTTRSPVHGPDPEDEQDEFQVGGSSGGEAALVKLGGSQLGVGTDMGGSVRQPACLAELVGFKYTSQPSGFRWQLPHDLMTGLPRTTTPATAPGLLARDVGTVRRVVAALEGGASPSAPAPQRVVYTAQYASPEVRDVVAALVSALADKLQCEKLAEVEGAAWEAVWAEHATQYGFSEARKMLANDPLIPQTMFDEARLETRTWPADGTRLEELTRALLTQTRIDPSDDGETLLLTPTYALGGPVRNAAFAALADQHAEAWCQIVNLLDWPAISVPLAHLTAETRSAIHEAASADARWAKWLPGRVAADAIEATQAERLPVLSVQLVAPPGAHHRLLDFAQRLAAMRV